MVAGVEVKVPVGQLHAVHDPEAIAPQLPRLSRPPRGPAAFGPVESVRTAPGPPVGGAFQVATGYLQHGVDVQVAVTGPDLAERDALGVAEQPGGLVVEGGDALLQRPDPEEHVERLALTAEGFTTWGSGHAVRSGCKRWGLRQSYPVYPGLVKRFTCRIFRLRQWRHLMEPLFTPVEA